MRKKIIGLVIIVILLSVLKSRSEEASIGLNGQTWQKLSEMDSTTSQMAKIILVRGIYEGAWAIDKEKAKEEYFDRVRYSSLANALDAFYSEYKNEKIPVSCALKIINMQLTGQRKDLIEEKTKQFRFEWARKSVAYIVNK
ncbi:MAG: hypothetical protein PHQ52_03320 [Candidatus Omnitrophica bacterium]|nr:hypothetical protein [Candidatus Omnitrophota bacterium]